MKDYFTKIPNDFIKGDIELNAKELTIATLLLETRNGKDICMFTLKWLYKKLNIADKNTYSQKEIKSILKMFSDEEIFFYHEDIDSDDEESLDINSIGKSDLIFAELYNDMVDNFTIIKDKDVKDIIKYSNNNRIDTFSLLTTYTYICSCINNNEQCEDYLLCFPSLINISENVNITEKTVLKYIDILKELNIFVFDYAGYKVLYDGKIKNGKMFYTRVENEQILLNKLQKEREEHGYISISKRFKDKSNLKRSIKQKINDLEKKEEINLIENEQLILLKEKYNELNNEKETKSE
jgi:hypothetical protein